jgi:hypothetical protein
MSAQTWSLRSDETPWTVGDAELAQQYGEPFGPTEILFTVANGDGDMVALCPWRPGDTKEDQEALRANARLIAAAPDLLGALRLLDIESLPDDVQIYVRQAIAKATE